jgi:hypothetical protein
MKRQLIHALLAVTAFAALAIAPGSATAQNSPQLQGALTVNTKIRGVNVGEVKWTSGSGTATCSSALLKGTLAKNNGSEVEAEISSASFSGGGSDERCGGSLQSWVSTSPKENGVPWCLQSTPSQSTDAFQIRGGACSKSATPIQIAFNVPTPALECVYERSAAIVGTFSTHPEDAVLTMSKVEFKKVSGNITCPSTWYSDSSLTFEKDEESTNPFYISGAPTLTYPTGTKLATGGKVRARNVGGFRFTDGGGSSLWECSSTEMTGTLNTNSGSAIEATIEGASISGTGTEGACTYSFGNTLMTLNPATNGLPWCLRATSAMASDEFQLRGNSCGGASRPIRLIMEVMATTQCLYERAEAIPGTYKTDPEDAALQISEAVFLEVSPKALCPDETKLDASLTLETDEAGTNPIYIS